MKLWKVRQYLPALLWYVQRRVEGGRGAVVSVHVRDICGIDRRCGIVVHMLMKSLIEKGLAKKHKRGTYLIERRAVEEVLAALRQWI
jgi:hypothetical protein